MLLFQITNNHFVYTTELCYMHDKFKKSKVEKTMMSIRNLRNDDKLSYMMPYNVFKEVLREVQEMRRSFTMRAHVWRRVFLAQEE
jgi:hypothetical protein